MDEEVDLGLSVAACIAVVSLIHVARHVPIAGLVVEVARRPHPTFVRTEVAVFEDLLRVAHSVLCTVESDGLGRSGIGAHVRRV